MALTLPNVTAGVLAAADHGALYRSIWCEVEFAGDANVEINAATRDMPTISVASGSPVSAGGTSITLTAATPVTLIAGTVINWFNGVSVALSGDATKGATSLSVEANDPYTGASHGAIAALTEAFLSDVQFQRDGESTWRFSLPLHHGHWATMLNSAASGSESLNRAIQAGDTQIRVWANAAKRLGLDAEFPFSIRIDNETVTATSYGASSVYINTSAFASAHPRGHAVTRVGATAAPVGKRLTLQRKIPDIPGSAAGVLYHVRLLITHPDLAGGEQIVTFDQTTRPDNLAAASTEVTNPRYLSGSGDNTADGLGAGTPWRTLKKAVDDANAAGAARTYIVDGGYYQLPLSNAAGVDSQVALTATDRVVFRAAESATCVPAVNDETEHSALPAGFTPTITNPGWPIVYDRYSAPTGSAEGAADWTRGFAGTAPWTLDTTLNPGQSIYYLELKTSHASGTEVDNAEVFHVGFSEVSGGNYAAAKAALPRRVAKWAHDDTTGSPNLDTAAGWTSLVVTNKSYNAGVYQNTDGVAGAGNVESISRLYVRFPGLVNPNDCYVWFGRWLRYEGTAGQTLAGFAVSANPTGAPDPGHRISGLTFRCLQNGVRVNAGVQNTIVDHCNMQLCGTNPLYGDSGAGRTNEIKGTVFDFPLWEDTEIWSPDETRRIPWMFGKQKLILANGSDYAGNRVGDVIECACVTFWKNCAHTVVRNARIDGMFNSFNTGGKSQIDESDCFNGDFYNIHGRYIGDNGPELSGLSGCNAAWDWFLEDCANFAEIDGGYGDFVAFRIRGFDVVNWGITDDGADLATPPVQAVEIGANSGLIKHGSEGIPRAGFKLFNSTFWNSRIHAKADQVTYFNASAGRMMEHLWVMNTIIRHISKLTSHPLNGPPWLERRNFWGTNSGTGGLQFSNREFSSASPTGATSLAEYRQWDLDTNAAGGTVVRGRETNYVRATTTDYPFVGTTRDLIDANLVNAVGRVLTVLPGGIFDGTGLPIPGISDPPALPGGVGLPPVGWYDPAAVVEPPPPPEVVRRSAGTRRVSGTRKAR